MSNPTRNSGFVDPHIDLVRRGFTSDPNRYIALMDLSHFLNNDTFDTFLPAAEVVLNRPDATAGLIEEFTPVTNQMGPATLIRHRNLDHQRYHQMIDPLEEVRSSHPPPPAPPLPRMMKNLFKDRRRLQQRLITAPQPTNIGDNLLGSGAQMAELYEKDLLANAHKAMERYKLPSILKSQLGIKPLNSRKKAYVENLLFATVTNGKDEEEDCLKEEMPFKIIS